MRAFISGWMFRNWSRIPSVMRVSEGWTMCSARRDRILGAFGQRRWTCQICLKQPAISHYQAELPANQWLCRSPTARYPSMLREMKSIYLESSVVSYLAACPSRDLVVAENQQVTRDWWETRRGECELFVSDVVVAECAAGDATAASERELFLAAYRSSQRRWRRKHWRMRCFQLWRCPKRQHLTLCT